MVRNGKYSVGSQKNISSLNIYHFIGHFSFIQQYPLFTDISILIKKQQQKTITTAAATETPSTIIKKKV
jgi:hypothetical protein